MIFHFIQFIWFEMSGNKKTGASSDNPFLSVNSPGSLLLDIFSFIPGAFYCCEYNGQRSIDFISKGFQRISGYLCSSFNGSKSRPFDSIIHRDDRQKCQTVLRKALDDELPFSLEWRLVREDGRVRLIHEYGRIVPGKKNNGRKIYGMLIDITPSKSDENAYLKQQTSLENIICSRTSEVAILDRQLDEETKQYSLIEKDIKEKQALQNIIFDGISEHVIYINLDYEVQWVNKSALNAAGKEWDEVVGRKCYEIWPRRDAPCKTCPCTKTFHTRETMNAVVTATSGKTCQEKSSPIFDADGKLIGAIEISSNITDFKKMEHNLLETQKLLEMKNKILEEKNIALKVLLEHQHKEKRDNEENIYLNIKNLILPYLDKLKMNITDEETLILMDIMKKNLLNVSQPLTKKLTNKLYNLSPMEIKVANLTKEDKTAKEIAEIFHVSENTIKVHKTKIRKKLNIKFKKVNLRSYLQNLIED